MAQNLDETKFAALRAAKDQMAGTTVKDMFAADPGRFTRYHVALDDLVFDYSKHRVDDTVLKALFDLARAQGLEGKRDTMFDGGVVNPTEKRAALHTALRNMAGSPVMVDGEDVMPDVASVRAKVAEFARGIRDGDLRGAKGQAFTDVVNIGIGGSDLGPAMAARALAPFGHPRIRTHFVSNVDGADLGDTLKGLDPATTLFIVASKTFTTQETMTNARSAPRLARGRARRCGGGAPLRRGFDQPRAYRQVRHQARADVRLQRLGRRPLFGVVEHRPFGVDPDRSRAVRRLPERRPRGRQRTFAKRRSRRTSRC